MMMCVIVIEPLLLYDEQTRIQSTLQRNAHLGVIQRRSRVCLIVHSQKTVFCTFHVRLTQPHNTQIKPYLACIMSSIYSVSVLRSACPDSHADTSSLPSSKNCWGLDSGAHRRRSQPRRQNRLAPCALLRDPTMGNVAFSVA
jgi:hypothetical protein